MLRTSLTVRPLAAVLLLASLVPAALAQQSKGTRPPRQPADLSVQDFFRPEEIREAKLNPSATHLALLVHDPKVDSRGITIVEIDTGKATGLRASQKFDIYTFRWVDDHRMVFSVSQDRRYAYGLFAITRERPQQIATVNRGDVLEVLSTPRARPDRVLVWIRQSARDDEDGPPEGFVEIDLRSDYENSSMEDANIAVHLPPPPGEQLLDWLVDQKGELRYAVTSDLTRLQLLRREDRRWVETPVNLSEHRPLAVDANPDFLLVVRRNAAGHHELVRLNTTDLTTGPVLHTDERYDFSRATVRFRNGEPVGLTYLREGPAQIWLQAHEQTRRKLIDAVLPPGRLNQVIGSWRNRVLVRSSSDRHPGELFVFDVDTMKIRRVGNYASWLPEPLLAPMQHTTFRTRDGLELDAFVTRPLGHDPKQPAPLVVLPHGGPWARDQLGFDAEAQFFASRGYVVFQPNYRGSTGYEAAISRESFEFRKMHDDVTDGVRALIADGVADPQRVAIVGASFGGYLAVCGAAFEPDLYRCAVTVAGVFDWERVMKDWRRESRATYMLRHLEHKFGDPRQNRAKFAELSPLTAADQIRVPVFVAHGQDDRIADVAHSRQLVKTLAAHRVPHETLFLKHVGHGLERIENRVELYTRIEAFLKKHL